MKTPGVQIRKKPIKPLANRVLAKLDRKPEKRCEVVGFIDFEARDFADWKNQMAKKGFKVR